MEKERKFKTIGLVAVFVAVIGLSIAFAALSRILTINGTGKVSSSTWSVVWEEIDTETLVLFVIISPPLIVLSINMNVVILYIFNTVNCFSYYALEQLWA